jgi:hypothetical protein
LRSTTCGTGPWNNPEALLLRINLQQPREPGAAEAKNRDAKDILGQLIHWAAHAATGISTGAEGRYHSREFADVAESLGFAEITYTRGLGYPPVLDDQHIEVITPEGLRYFAPETKALDKAMSVWEPAEGESARKKSRAPVTMICQCDPPLVLHVSEKAGHDALVRCEKCGARFTIRASRPTRRR